MNSKILGIALAIALIIPATAQSKARERSAETAAEGVVRISGSIEMRPLLKSWAAGFARLNPRVRIVDRLRGNASGIYGLEQRTSDIALMGRGIHPFERYGTYERSWTYPVGIEVANGAAGGETAPYVIVVHRANPLARLSVAELDGVFGAARDGGWDKLVWNTAAARGASSNIRFWRELGIGGALGERPITPYGEALLGAGGITDFQEKVMQGGSMWNEALREFPTRDALLTALRADPAGIGVTTAGPLPPGLKAIPVAAIRGGPAIAASPATIADRTYPLARAAYAFVTIDDVEGELAEPRVAPATAAFLRYILSPAGQRVVAGQAFYLPLTPAITARQLDILDSRAWPEERPRPRME